MTNKEKVKLGIEIGDSKKLKQLEELLYRWADIEPEKCKKHDEEANMWSVIRWEMSQIVTLIARIGEDRIFGAVVEAIKEKKWLYTCGVQNSGPFAKVYRVWSPWTMVEEHDFSLVESEPTELIALLTAYLNLLDQQK
jgi:hypothetical protein